MQKALPSSSDPTATSKAQSVSAARRSWSRVGKTTGREAGACNTLSLKPEASLRRPARRPGSCRRLRPCARCERGNRGTRVRGRVLVGEHLAHMPTCHPFGHQNGRVTVTHRKSTGPSPAGPARPAPRPLVLLQGRGQCLPPGGRGLHPISCPLLGRGPAWGSLGSSATPLRERALYQPRGCAPTRCVLCCGHWTAETSFPHPRNEGDDP